MKKLFVRNGKPSVFSVIFPLCLFLYSVGMGVFPTPVQASEWTSEQEDFKARLLTHLDLAPWGSSADLPQSVKDVVNQQGFALLGVELGCKVIASIGQLSPEVYITDWETLKKALINMTPAELQALNHKLEAYPDLQQFLGFSPCSPQNRVIAFFNAQQRQTKLTSEGLKRPDLEKEIADLTGKIARVKAEGR